MPKHFLEEIIERDVSANKALVTRFPPEPNGFLHIGHAKSICLNFGLAQTYQGKCNLRFDDTNPEKESQRYIDAIKQDIHWLGFTWDNECYTSDYFDTLYTWAELLIQNNLAYVDSLPAEKMRTYRGTLTSPGINSPDRSRPIAQSLELFRRMKAGEFADGSYVLRAKIDMAHPNINMRDPTLYRIRRQTHPRTGKVWCIYPSYDYAHGQSDAIEGVSHSICTIEFEDHRLLYNWLISKLPVPTTPKQYEFSRLQLEHTVTSKRKLNTLVETQQVQGWDDPRMPTLCGMRKRGFPPEAIRDFCSKIGVTKKYNTIEMSLLEHCVRQRLEQTTHRAFAVRNPIKLCIDNWPSDKKLRLDLPWYTKRISTDPPIEMHEQNQFAPAQADSNTKASAIRHLDFGKELWIDGNDFMFEPPKGYYRLHPGGSVRLKHAFIIDFVDVEYNASGQLHCIHCTYDPDTQSGQDTSGRKVRGAIQWVPANAIPLEALNISNLFSDAEATTLNPHSLVTEQLLAEPYIDLLANGTSFQFERLGFYRKDEQSQPGKPVCIRTVTLRDSWGKKHAH